MLHLAPNVGHDITRQALATCFAALGVAPVVDFTSLLPDPLHESGVFQLQCVYSSLQLLPVPAAQML